MANRINQQLCESRLADLVKEFGVDAVLAAAEKLLAGEPQKKTISDNVLVFRKETDRKKEKVINRLLEHAEKLRW